jgi:hypothetical protein
MVTRKQIKIVKRAERAEQDQPGATANKPAGAAHRDGVTVIAEWVRELREKKPENAARGLKSLFPNAA